MDGNGWRREGTFQVGSLVTGKRFKLDGALAYEGEYKEGWAHGMGTSFNPDGKVLTGRWEGNVFKDGTGTYPSGRVEKYVNGEVVWIV